MNAGTLPHSNGYRDESLGRPLAFAIGLHVLVALFLWLASWLSWDHDVSSAAGASIEATMETSAAENSAVERALRADPVPPPPPVEEVAEEETVPPPQPIPEPRPQDSPVEQQRQAQERIPVPDTTDQDEASREAISQEKALKEQEEKRRQEQIDLTEQKRVEEAQKQQRLAQQQEADKQAKLAEIRRQRAQLDQQQKLAEQKLRQIADARSASASASAATSNNTTAAQSGQSGSDEGLLAKYRAAIQTAVTNQWTRPDTVPLGTRCKIVIRQLPGGEVMSAEVQPGCPMGKLGQESIERAVLKAQPLPYRGFESVFNRTLIFTFEAQDR